MQWLEASLAHKGYGQSVTQHGVHVRFFGGVAASGRMQVLVSCGDSDLALAIWTILYDWWTVVPVSVDGRGYRMVSLRWFHDRA